MNKLLTKEQWQYEIGNCITDIDELLSILDLSVKELNLPKKNIDFPLRVPRSFAKRIKKNDPNDPLLLQILPLEHEEKNPSNFIKDPLKEKSFSIHSSLIHKYKHRVLIKLTTYCPVNCRYCFRRHFSNDKLSLDEKSWLHILTYIKKHNIQEVILSGGDPLIYKDDSLINIFDRINRIQSINKVRIHSRIPIVLPSRITNNLAKIFTSYNFKVILVTHCNHANEINAEVIERIVKLKDITILNQTVLLKNINDSGSTLIELSNKLFEARILPYYIHLLDPVEGASHYNVQHDMIEKILICMMENLPGYLVPKFVKEVPGKPYKIPFLNIINNKETT